MPAEGKRQLANRRRFLGCAAGVLGIAAAPTREEPEEVIPLRSVVTTTSQEGLVEVPWKRILGSDKFGRLVDSREVGPANLFLVVGKDFDAALDATCAAFFHGVSVNGPVVRLGDSQAAGDRFWAFVYFGAARTGPQEWTLTRCAVQGSRVRVTAARPDPKEDVRVPGRRVHMFWVPLAEQNEKAYTLEAYDETNRAMIMTRRVVMSS